MSNNPDIKYILDKFEKSKGMKRGESLDSYMYGVLVGISLLDLEDEVKEKDPVRLPDGSIQNFTLKIAGNSHRCKCGCNVFHKPSRLDPDKYECNGCGWQFIAE